MASSLNDRRLQKTGTVARRAKRAREPGILTAKQIKAVEMLAGGTVARAEIARRVRVHRGTLARWQGLPQFRQALQDVASEALADARRVLQANSCRAAQRLVKTLATDSDRAVRAALEILRFTLGDPGKVELTTIVSQTQGQMQLPPEFLKWLDVKGKAT